MNRVRVKSVYTFQPVGIDKFDPRSDAKPGDQVRVINLRGAPKANTMGHCHIESLDGEFLGMVHVNSLVRDNPKEAVAKLETMQTDYPDGIPWNLALNAISNL
jgi:hypothetical protein